MARKKIREYDAKRLIAEKLGLDYNAVLVTPEADLENLPLWTHTIKLTVKPDQLFGKRKKHGLVLLNADLEQAKRFIKENTNKEVTLGKATDKLTHFLIEPYLEHEEEYYLSIVSGRDHDIINFSEEGGIEIEENWHKIKRIEVPTLKDIKDLDLNVSENIEQFIKSIFEIFREENFCYLELNPFTIKDGKVVILDTVAQVDSCSVKTEFPKPFGRKIYPEEKLIENIDSNSGASLKLTVLNPNGKIWNILGGGGASIIYLDMITNLGKGNEIANYGESSGNPSTEECYQYAKAILELMCKNNGKILFIVGGIANFTDVRDTFKGFSRALEEFTGQLKQNNVTIFIRRGGPHYLEGLELIRKTCANLGLKHYVHGPETSMPEIIKIAEESLS